MKQARPKQRGGRFAGQAYHQAQSVYAKRFGVTTRTIKTWWKQGLPCDDADAMGEFISSRGRKPEAVEFAEDPPRGAEPAALRETLADQLAERRATILDESFLEGEGLIAAMARISKMEVALADKLHQEMNKPGFNFREFNNRFGIWIGMLKTMGKIEKDAPGILEKNKNQIDVGEVEEGVTKLLLDIVGRLALIPIRCRQELAAMTDPQEIEDFVTHEISIALDPVRKCEWMPADQRPAEVQEPPVNDTPRAGVRIWSILDKAVKAALVVREALSLRQWSEKFVELSSKWSAKPGRYSSAPTGYLRPVMEALTDKRVRRVTVVKGAQIGFTTLLANWLMYLVDMDPGPALLCQPSRKIMRRYVKKELHPRFLGCERLKAYIPANQKEKFTAEEMYFTSMDLFCTGVGSPALLASLPIKYGIGDEVDKWSLEDDKEASRKDLLAVRLMTYEALGTSKLVLGSTPTIPEMTISTEASKGTCEHIYVPCPMCGFEQEIVFEHFIWKHAPGVVNADGSWNLDAVQAGTGYECQNPEGCGIIPQDKKAWMVPRATSRAHNENAPKTHRSFYIGGEYGALSWGQLAAKFLELQHVPGGLHNFWNNYLGRAWERKTGGATKKAVAQIQAASPKYELGNPEEKDALLTLPFRPCFLTMHVDVQQAEFYWTMRAWLPDGSRAVIAVGQCVSFSEIEDLSNRVWTFDHGDGGPLEEFTIWMGVMDSGYRARRGASVYRFVHEQGGRWTASKGGTFRGKDLPISETTVPFRYEGEEVQVPLMHYNDDQLKEHLYRFVLQERKFPLLLPQKLPADFVEQLTAEKLVKVKNSEGRTENKWRPDIDPHYGDCEKMAELFAFTFTREVLAQALVVLDEKRAQFIAALKANNHNTAQVLAALKAKQGSN